MDYDEIDQYVDQLFRDEDTSDSKDSFYRWMLTTEGRARSNEELWKEYNSQGSIYIQNSIRGLTCAEWILIAAIGIGLLLFMMIKA
jgi:hypothetical protein